MRSMCWSGLRLRRVSNVYVYFVPTHAHVSLHYCILIILIHHYLHACVDFISRKHHFIGLCADFSDDCVVLLAFMFFEHTYTSIIERNCVKYTIFGEKFECLCFNYKGLCMLFLCESVFCFLCKRLL